MISQLVEISVHNCLGAREGGLAEGHVEDKYFAAFHDMKNEGQPELFQTFYFTKTFRMSSTHTLNEPSTAQRINHILLIPPPLKQLHLWTIGGFEGASEYKLKHLRE